MGKYTVDKNTKNKIGRTHVEIRNHSKSNVDNRHSPVQYGAVATSSLQHV